MKIIHKGKEKDINTDKLIECVECDVTLKMHEIESHEGLDFGNDNEINFYCNECIDRKNESIEIEGIEQDVYFYYDENDKINIDVEEIKKEFDQKLNDIIEEYHNKENWEVQ